MTQYRVQQHRRRSPSRDFIEFRSSLAHLRQHLLPPAPSPVGDYPDDQEVKTLAFIVLAHAEIETYIENRVLEMSLNSKRLFDATGKVNNALAATLAHCGSPDDIEKTPDPSKYQNWLGLINLTDRTTTAVNRLRRIINNNHGIRESNLARLLSLIGIDARTVDPQLVRDLDSLGQTRGRIAHSSISQYGAGTQLDPFDQLYLLEQIKIGLRQLDDELRP